MYIGYDSGNANQCSIDNCVIRKPSDRWNCSESIVKKMIDLTDLCMGQILVACDDTDDLSSSRSSWDVPT